MIAEAKAYSEGKRI